MGATPRLRAATRAALLLAVLAACNDGVDKDEPSQDKVDTGGDADTDADTDTDVDSDIDTDTDPAVDPDEPCPLVPGLARDRPVYIAPTAGSVRGDGPDLAFNTAFVGGNGHHYTKDVNNITLTLDTLLKTDNGESVQDTGAQEGDIYCSEDPPPARCAGENFMSGQLKSPGAAFPDEPNYGYGCYSARITRARLDGTISAFFIFEDFDPDSEAFGHEEADVAEIYGVCKEEPATGVCTDYWVHFPWFGPDGKTVKQETTYDVDLIDQGYILDPDSPPLYSMLWNGNTLQWWVKGKPATMDAHGVAVVTDDYVPTRALPAWVNLWAVDNDGMDGFTGPVAPEDNEGGWYPPGWPDDPDACDKPPGCTPLFDPISHDIILDPAAVPPTQVESVTASFDEVQWIPLVAGGPDPAEPAPAAAASRCQDGSGLFLLVPHGSRRGRYRPVEVAGTGVLADDAAIVRARAVGGSAATRAGDRRSVALGSAWTELGGAGLGGGVSFGGMRSATAARMVELEWSCPSGARGDGATAPAGTHVAALSDAFRLSDVGCPVDWPQLFTLGIEDPGADGDAAIWIATWGSPGVRRSIPLVRGAGGHRGFRLAEGGLVVAGSVVSRGARRATLAVEEVTWRGMGLCDPGVYGVPLARRPGEVDELEPATTPGECVAEPGHE